VHDLLAQHPKANNVIVGIRPEHLEDAALIDTYARIRALTFEVKVDFVESLGADKYVHFKTEGGGAQAAQLVELAADSGVNENEFVARVSTQSTATPGQTMELAFDTSKITIFDADTGANLTIAPSEQVPGEQVPGEQVPGEQVPGEQVPGEQVPGEQALLPPPPPPAE
jgi:multiple sugar transport system ATP-binding protein